MPHDAAPHAMRALLDANPIVGDVKHGGGRLWNTREIAILREHWPTAGIAGCLPLLPGRSAHGIYAKAAALGLLSPETVRRGGPRQRYTSSEHIDRAIVAAYASALGRGKMQRLSATLMRPQTWIKRRALHLGCVVPRLMESDWCEAEIAILEKNATRDPHAVARILGRAGYRRTASAVVVKRKRLHIDHFDPDHFSARGLAALLGVDVGTVLRLIARGLPAKRRREDSAEWRISRRGLRQFIRDNPTAIDVRKVEGVWFIELLTGGDLGVRRTKAAGGMTPPLDAAAGPRA